MTETTKPERIKLDEADFATLKEFAETALGIEIRQGCNSSAIIAKIKAVMPSLTDVPALKPEPEPIAAPAPLALVPEVDGEDPARRPAAVSRPASIALRRYQNDPKVELTVHKTSDRTRAPNCDLCVNGDAFIIKRGQRVSVPLRVYYALENAKEQVSVETDEVNPFSGLPVREWQEVHSYPFQVHTMPSDEEIAKWHADTSDGFKSQAA